MLVTSSSFREVEDHQERLAYTLILSTFVSFVDVFGGAKAPPIKQERTWQHSYCWFLATYVRFFKPYPICTHWQSRHRQLRIVHQD